MGLFGFFRKRRRERLVQEPFPEAWREIIDLRVPYYRSLGSGERARLEDLIKVFVAEKNFEGCGGLEITDEIKVTIAAQACLLLLNLRHNYFRRLVSILVYPRMLAFRQEQQGPGGVVTVSESPVLGLSASVGTVVLSWADTVAGALRPGDGSNVVLHEFAHQLDLLDGSMDGAPPLEHGAHYRDWARVLGSEFEQLRRQTEGRRSTLISAYGATKPVEFFAVVTELFFERSEDLRRLHPDLYAEFRRYYRQDPAARNADGKTT